MKKQNVKKSGSESRSKSTRKSGILLPVASLPGPYGIGCFSRFAYDFVDFLAEAGQSFWQLLPLGPTSFGDSPYQSFSTFAGNPYFIDPDTLVEDGLLRKKECQTPDFGRDPARADYAKLYKYRFRLLKSAYDRFETSDEYERFNQENCFWLDDYALFMSIKDSFKGAPFSEWPEDIRLRKKRALIEMRRSHENDMEFYRFQQYEFFRQWGRLKAYANEKGVKIIGDLPIYVAYDSADVWANPELFQLDRKLAPVAVAGCPPDDFSSEGQLWGNPLYNWDKHKETGYRWWTDRIEHCFTLYDVLRIDHFKGFESYYSIPSGMDNAKNGEWVEGPGYAVFSAVKIRLGNKPLIAEDLGFLTPGVEKLLKKCGYPGMKVLQFAFDPDDTDGSSAYLPHNYNKNTVVYTGTHDNATTAGWYDSLKIAEKKKVRAYLNIRNRRDVCSGMVRAALASVSDTCVIPVQDWLELGNEARINTPSTLGGNWEWRMSPDVLTDSLAKRIRDLTALYGRLPQKT